MRMLIVDDNRNFGRFLFGSLATRGYESRIVTTAEHARASARDMQPTLYLIDVRLPDGDGRELAREFLDMGATPDQIVFMTAMPKTELGDVSALTSNPVLRKPFRLDDLLDRVRERVEQRQ